MVTPITDHGREMTMGIAPIAPYDMPGLAQAGRNIARWRPDRRRAVLLIHDMQRYFLTPFAADEPPAKDLLDHVRSLRDAADESGVPVVYTVQRGGATEAERGLLKDFWGMGMTSHPDDSAIVAALGPHPAHRIFTKWRYSAFHRTGLLYYLREHNRDQLLICGVYAHLGCLITAYDSFSHDIETFLAGDAVADFSHRHHTMALANAAAGCAVVLPTAELVDRLRHDTHAAHTEGSN